MTLKQELECLSNLENDILINGKIELDNEHKPFETRQDADRLKKYKFFELQDKYSYGWYIAEDDLESQLTNLAKFRLYISQHYFVNSNPDMENAENIAKRQRDEIAKYKFVTRTAPLLEQIKDYATEYSHPKNGRMLVKYRDIIYAVEANPIDSDLSMNELMNSMKRWFK